MATEGERKSESWGRREPPSGPVCLQASFSPVWWSSTDTGVLMEAKLRGSNNYVALGDILARSLPKLDLIFFFHFIWGVLVLLMFLMEWDGFAVSRRLAPSSAFVSSYSRRRTVVVYWVVKKSNGKTQNIVPESRLQVWWVNAGVVLHHPQNSSQCWNLWGVTEKRQWGMCHVSNGCQMW